jgi:hypothetical protein
MTTFSKIFPGMLEYTDDLLSPGQVAKLAGVSYSTVMRAIHKEQLKAIKHSVVVMTGSKRIGRRPMYVVKEKDAKEYSENVKSKKARANKRRCQKMEGI